MHNTVRIPEEVRMRKKDLGAVSVRRADAYQAPWPTRQGALERRSTQQSRGLPFEVKPKSKWLLVRETTCSNPRTCNVNPRNQVGYWNRPALTRLIPGPRREPDMAQRLAQISGHLSNTHPRGLLAGEVAIITGEFPSASMRGPSGL